MCKICTISAGGYRLQANSFRFKAGIVEFSCLLIHPLEAGHQPLNLIPHSHSSQQCTASILSVLFPHFSQKLSIKGRKEPSPSLG